MAPLRNQMDGEQQQLERSGHNAEPLDNGIADVDDPVAFQRLCRRFSAAHIQRNLMLRLRKTASIFHCADLRSELMPRMPAAGYGSDDRISWTPQVSASAVAPAFVPIPYPPYNALTVNSRSVHTIECFQPGSSP